MMPRNPILLYRLQTLPDRQVRIGQMEPPHPGPYWKERSHHPSHIRVFILNDRKEVVTLSSPIVHYIVSYSES